jgi:hypothetical protein
VPDRIVVSFRGFVPLRGDGARYLERALSVKQQAEAYGANLCAWGSRTFSFDFSSDELEEAIALALLAESERGVARRARFGVGIAEGEMRVVGEGGSLAVLSWGAGLVRSVALARIARAGEVLVDPRLPAARRGDLLSKGARLGLDPGGPVRGLTLDLETPWRKDAADAVSRLAEPTVRVGPIAANEIQIPAGSLGLVRAPPGSGGSRLLHDWLDARRGEASSAGGRCVFVRPEGSSVEPFGALRVAIAQSIETDGEVLLSPEMAAIADDLFAERGGTVRNIARLLDAVVTGGGAAGALAIDGVTRIDGASLRAISVAMVLRGAFPALCRLDDKELLPRELAMVTLGPATALAPLSAIDGALLARAFTRGELDPKLAARWARRGQQSALALRESLAESIVSGELRWRDTGIEARGRSSGRGRPAPAGRWILRRLARAPVDQREILAAVAVLGRDALAEELGEIVEQTIGRTVSCVEIVERLVQEGWLSRTTTGRVRLTTDTCRDTLLDALSSAERNRRQKVAVEMLARDAGPCRQIEAAWLALEAGELDAALEWAEAAASHLSSIGLEPEMRRLVSMFNERDPKAAARIERAVTDATPPAQAVREDDQEPLADTQQAPSGENLAEAADSNLQTAETPIAPHQVVAAHLAEAARRALRSGDAPALDGALRQLKSAGGNGDWVEMMSGLAALGRGATEEALRILKAAAADDDAKPQAQKTRSRLAYAVALGAVGRQEAALFEALEVLACAREAGDRSGELACVRLLSRLAHAAGQADASMAWSAVADVAAASGVQAG